jgi:hypothetical protein
MRQPVLSKRVEAPTRPAAALLLAALAAACGGGGRDEGGIAIDTGRPQGEQGAGDVDDGVDTLPARDTGGDGDFAGCDIAALFATHGCTSSGCHGDLNRSTPELVAPGFAERLINAPSARPGCDSRLIDARDWQASQLLRVVDPGRYNDELACGAPMPPTGARLSAAEVDCLESWVRFVAEGADPDRDGDLSAEFEPQSVESAVAKVKALLVGAAVTDEDLAIARATPGGLRELAQRWVAGDNFEQVATSMLKTAFRLGEPRDPRSLLDAEQRFGFSLAATSAESVERTIWNVVGRDEPMTRLVSNPGQVMTTAELVLAAYFDSRPSELNSTHLVLDGDPSGIDPREMAATRTWTFSLGCPPSRVPANGGWLVLERQLLPMLFGTQACADGGTQPLRSEPIAPESARSDWRTVEFVEGEREIPFYDVEGLRRAPSVKLRVVRPGLFSSMAFRATWPTNRDNDYRVTLNETLIGALSATFAIGDPTPAMSTNGLDPAHAAEGTDCQSCHRLLDPMRLYFSSVLDTRQFVREVDEVGPEPAFAFVGATGAAPGLTGLSQALVDHPRFAIGMTQHVCTWANGTRCDESDPTFVAIADAFRSGGWRFRDLVVDVLTSPLTTGRAFSEQFRSRRFATIIARRDTLCEVLDQRLQSDVCAESQTALAAGLIPADTVERGKLDPAIAVEPNPFHLSVVESLCRGVSLLPRVISASPGARFSSTDAAFAIPRIVSELMGLPDSHPRHLAAVTAMIEHYSDAREQGASPETALRSVFVLACQSPDVVGVGL